MSLNWLELFGAINLLLTGLLAVAMIIPGEFPDKQLQFLVDLLKKFSKK